jgi:hypothetical protein
MAVMPGLHLEADNLSEEYTILAPGEGFRESDFDFLALGVEPHIEVDAVLNGRRTRWRVFPEREEISRSPLHPSVFHISSALAVIISNDGRETGKQCYAYLYINLEVRTKGTPAGFLRVRQQDLPV